MDAPVHRDYFRKPDEQGTRRRHKQSERNDEEQRMVLCVWSQPRRMNLFRLYITEKYSLGIEVSSWVVALALLLIVAFVIWRRVARQHHVVEVNINLCGLGWIKICPTWEETPIGPQIW